MYKKKKKNLHLSASKFLSYAALKEGCNQRLPTINPQSEYSTLAEAAHQLETTWNSKIYLKNF